MSAILPGLQAFSSAFNRIAMKKLLYILAGLGLAACTSDIEELPEVGPQPGREVALTGISGTASRTQFVPGDGTEIQFQWSTGDRIWAGGVQSAEAGTDGNVADFGFTNLPGAAPYRIYYNMTGTDAEAVVPTEQRQAEPGKLQLGPNGDFGYATTDSEGRFTLSHATAYVWFNPWSQDVKEKLVSVTLAATDASTVLTGTRTFDGTGFSDATDANNAVTLSFGKEGVELPATSSTASVFAAAVVYPADCSAEEIHVTYTFADGSVYTETKTGRNFEAGRIYRLTTEITKRDGGSLEIQGLEDSDEPVCMKYGASEAYALTAGGWIPTVEMTSAPAGWTADFDIARRSLLIAPPAEYTDGMDLENTVTIQSDDKPILSQEYYVLDFTHPEGTFVLIEGNMTSENGTIVYFDQHMRYHEKVYEEINDNEIGNVLQDMYLANGKIYFITQNGKTSSMGTTFNGDGRFVVCDAHTMKRLVARDMPFYANIEGRMARGRSGNRRNARTGRRGVPRNTPPLRQPENPRGESRTKTRRHAEHSLRRLLADGSAFELCRPADRRRRRTIRLYPGHGQSVAPHRHGGGIPAGRNVRLLDQRRLRRIAQGTSGDRPQIHGYAPRAGREGL